MSNDTKMTAGSIEFFRSKNCAEADYHSLNSNFMVERSVLRNIFDFWLEQLSFSVLNCKPIFDRKSIELHMVTLKKLAQSSLWLGHACENLSDKLSLLSYFVKDI